MQLVQRFVSLTWKSANFGIVLDVVPRALADAYLILISSDDTFL
jgi:hypothetical protein